MKIKYNKEQDIIYLSLQDIQIFESDEGNKGIIIDYSKEGQVVGIEILNASQYGEPAKVEYEFAVN